MLCTACTCLDQFWVQQRTYQHLPQDLLVLLHNFGILKNMPGGSNWKAILSGEIRQRMCQEFVKSTLNDLIKHKLLWT